MNVVPLCYGCDRLADVLVLDRGCAQATAYPFCDECDPDPDEFGNRSTWGDKLTLRRFDEAAPDYDVYGRPGGSKRDSRIFHVETPAADGVLCPANISGRRRFNLSVVPRSDDVVCGRCTDTSAWRDDYNDDVVGGYLFELRRILHRNGQLRTPARHFIKYPQPDPVTNHRLVEGGDRRGV